MKSSHAFALPLVAVLLFQKVRAEQEVWTEPAKTNFLQEVLDNQFLRSPVAVVLDLTPQSTRGFKKLLYDIAEAGLSDREVLYLPVNEVGITRPGLYDTDDLIQAIAAIRTKNDASATEEAKAGPLLSAVVSATHRLPFDSAVIVVAAASPRDSGLADAATEMLIRKRARMYVIWMGEPDSGENVLRETALLTGGAHYDTKTNAIVRPRMLRIDNSLLEQDIISCTEVQDRLESRFVTSEDDTGLRVQVTGNISQATLIDPQGGINDLLESSNGTDVDIVVSTKDIQPGVWLLVTDGEPDQRYDLNITREALNDTDDETSADGNGAGSQEAGDEADSSRRQRRFAREGGGEARFLFPEASEDQRAANGTREQLSQQKSLSNLPLPFIIELATGSNLEVQIGRITELQYNIKNNLNSALNLNFYVTGSAFRIISVEPQRYRLEPEASIRVMVRLEPGQSPTQNSILEFVVAEPFSGTSRFLRAQLQFTRETTSDTWNPELTYKFQGDCRQYDEPNTCSNGQWRVEATAKDEDSGLLKVMSEPYNLFFREIFVAGTKLPVSFTYEASCCKPKVDIWAEDLRGNYKKKSLDVFNQGLTAGEIAAIVVGVILFIVLIILLVISILYCRRRNTEKLILPRHRSDNR